MKDDFVSNRASSLDHGLGQFFVIKSIFKRVYRICIFYHSNYGHVSNLYVSQSACLSVCLFMSVSISVRSDLSIYLSFFLLVHPSLPVFLPDYLSVCLRTRFYVSVDLSPNLSVCLSFSFYLSAFQFPPVCLYLYLSLCLSVFKIRTPGFMQCRYINVILEPPLCILLFACVSIVSRF